MLRLSDKTVAARDLLPGDIIRLTGARVAEVDLEKSSEHIAVRFTTSREWYLHRLNVKIEVCRWVVWP